ncbi:MAG: ROK family protein [Ardenticatenia bacterium]|nr:ROK family protein [Ardenticatenia bacterium]
MGTHAIAVDVGGTHIRAAVITSEGHVVHVVRDKTHAEEGPRAVVARVIHLTRAAMAECERQQVVGVGVAAPGPVDPDRGLVMYPPNLPGWGEIPLARLLEEALELPVWLGNDANLAALGEHRFGAGRGTAHMIYITISTGVGGGIIVNRRLVTGALGLAAEVGHMPLIPEGPLCSCGHRGHLEALAAGPSIAREARAAVERGWETALATLDHPLSAEDVVAAARAGDRVALELLARAGTHVGRAMALLVHLFNPERFVVGGGVSNAGDLILEPARRAARRHVLPTYRHTFDVVPASLGDNAGVVGAAVLVFEAVGAGGAVTC